MRGFEDEIDLLESTLSHLEDARDAIKDVPYYKSFVDRWEDDIDEIQGRLNELNKYQNDEWEAEKKDEINGYWRNAI